VKNLYVSDLFLALEDLLHVSPDSHRAKIFANTLTGQLYQEILAKGLEDLRALPPEMIGGRPFAEELGQLDLLHDGFGGAFIEMMNGYLRIPTLSAARRAKVELLLREFATKGFGELRASYPDEAAMAKERQPKLAQYKEMLREFPLADGVTCYDLIRTQIESGITINQKMSERAKTEAEQGERSRAGAGKLRGSLLGTLTRCRAALSDEVKMKSSLPRNLDAQLFGYFDELDAKRAASQSQEKKLKVEEKPKSIESTVGNED
jgi:hypothetical protein